MRTNQWRHGIVIGVLILAIVWLLWLIAGILGKAQIAMTQAGDVKRQYQALEARKTALTAKMTSLDTPLGQDAAIRTAFGVARPGEEVIVVVPPATTTATSTGSWWSWLWGWL